MGTPAKAKVKAICKDRTVRIHCAFITITLILSAILMLALGADGGTIATLLSPVTMYGQDITDALKRIGK